ncbi:MAG TPA: penicillin acylase family protein [Chitinophagales bacterium]|nr:penicillin acylase family protein [Chitinophagales bacterium]
MKYLKPALSLTITVALVFALNSQLGVAPPFGKFLNPFGGFWQNAESTSGWKDENENLEGLKDEVKVYFDDRLVPHVFAKNDEDLYYMQGYISAKYRLWQMEVQTHNAAGRVCEVVGEKALESDRLQRRIGMGYGAEAAQQYIEKDPESKKLLQAYCNGVNAYIKNLDPKDYPLEYKLLNYAPEEWQPIKVALLLKNMANMLSVYEYDIENSNFIAKYGEENFRKLYPDYWAGDDPIIPVGTKWDAEPGIRNAELNTNKQTTQRENTELYQNAIQKPDELNGSNNWAVDGSKTKSGKPILCNDPHLALSLPSIWYEMHLVSPNMNVYGATLPGSPAVVIGFNDSISWGVTNAGRDVRDWYRLKFKDDSKNEYEYNGQWVKTEKRIERYKVRGKGEVIDTVLYTRFGPVVYDDNFGVANSKKYLSMRWTAHLPSNEFNTFYKLNCGRNYNDYLDALKTYTCPAQNFVFASRSGDVAMLEQGKFPIRNKATEQGKYICDGTTSADEWTDFIPEGGNPLSHNPPRGFVSSANQHPTDSTYPYYYSGVGVYEQFRNRRINKILAEGKDIDFAFMQKMQNDNYNLFAEEVLPVMLACAERAGVNAAYKPALDNLKSWDYFNNPNSQQATYFEEWWVSLRDLLWDEMSDPAYPLKRPNEVVTIGLLQNDSTSEFYDDKRTSVKENRDALVVQALDSAMQRLTAKYKTLDAVADWGKHKATKVAHLAKQDAFSSLNVYNGGNRGIINATNSTHGPSWRMIVDEGAMKGYVVYPGGQSGNPGSKYYDNMVKTWAEGNYYEANFIKTGEELGSKKLFTSTYKPKQ